MISAAALGRILREIVEVVETESAQIAGQKAPWAHHVQRAFLVKTVEGENRQFAACSVFPHAHANGSR